MLLVEAIVNGEWRQQLVVPGMTADDIKEALKNQYDLDEYVSERLVIGYETFTEAGNKKWKELNSLDVLDELGIRTTVEGDQVAITLDDLEFYVQQNQGDEVDEDVSCDSSFMLEIIPTLVRH